MQKPADVLRLLRENPEAAAREAADEIRMFSGVRRHDIAVVFGSGWDPAAEKLGRPTQEFEACRATGFLPPVVEGHAGLIRSVRIGRRNVLVFRGRQHLYQFPDDVTGMPAVMHYVRVAKATGCRIFIHTNAVGGLQPSLRIGQLVVVSDHNDVVVKVTSPLRGAPIFLDCSALYNPRLRRICRSIDPRLVEGVMANIPGPHLETPEVARHLGNNESDIVGMSMIPEAIMANHLKMRFLGLSLVTDVAGTAVTHAQVQDVVRRRAPALGRFLRKFVQHV